MGGEAKSNKWKRLICFPGGEQGQEGTPRIWPEEQKFSVHIHGRGEPNPTGLLNGNASLVCQEGRRTGLRRDCENLAWTTIIFPFESGHPFSLTFMGLSQIEQNH